MVEFKGEWEIRKTESGRFSIESPDPAGGNPPEIIASCFNENWAKFIAAAPAMYKALKLACENMSDNLTPSGTVYGQPAASATQARPPFAQPATPTSPGGVFYGATASGAVHSQSKAPPTSGPVRKNPFAKPTEPTKPTSPSQAFQGATASGAVHNQPAASPTQASTPKPPSASPSQSSSTAYGQPASSPTTMQATEMRYIYRVMLNAIAKAEGKG